MGSNIDYLQSFGSRSDTVMRTPEILIFGGAGQI